MSIDRRIVNVLLNFHKESSILKYGEVPVLFSVGEITLLDRLPLSLASFATWGMACLRVADKSGEAVLELDEYANAILFKKVGEQILVHNTMNGLTAKVSYDILFSTWKEFAYQVREAYGFLYPEGDPHGWWELISEYPPPLLEANIKPSADYGEAFNNLGKES